VGDAMKWMNLVLALLGSLAAFASLNKMEHGKTRPCIIGATILIALGLAGQWLSLAHEQWLPFIDTALYGGVLALLIASQRTPTWFLDRWANPIASLISVGVGALFLLGVLGLAGCAAAEAPENRPWEGVCLEQYIGKTPEGLAVVSHLCVPKQALEAK
jgi:hypothetical protein